MRVSECNNYTIVLHVRMLMSILIRWEGLRTEKAVGRTAEEKLYFQILAIFFLPFPEHY